MSDESDESDEWKRKAWTLLRATYPQPEAARIFVLQCGYPADRLHNAPTGAVLWVQVETQVELGISEELTVRTLLEAAERDYPGNAKIKALLGRVSARLRRTVKVMPVVDLTTLAPVYQHHDEFLLLDARMAGLPLGVLGQSDTLGYERLFARVREEIERAGLTPHFLLRALARWSSDTRVRAAMRPLVVFFPKPAHVAGAMAGMQRSTREAVETAWDEIRADAKDADA